MNSGRCALYVILKAMRLGLGARVGVQPYTCPSVFYAIRRAGLMPIFIDIDPRTYTLDLDDVERKARDLDALVLIHTFGYPADVKEVRDAAGVPIIEDCAHSLSSSRDGKPTGTLGDAAFFSFRVAKYISGGEGAAIINNTLDPDLLRREVEALPRTGFFEEVKHSFYVYLKSSLSHKPWYGLLSPLMRWYMDGNLMRSDNQDFPAYQMRSCNLAVINHKISKFRENMDRQRQHAQIILHRLEDSNIRVVQDEHGVFNNRFLFPLQFSDVRERHVAYEYMRSRGVDTPRIYETVPEIVRQYYNYESDCPVSERCASTVLTVPHHYSLTDEEMAHVVSIVESMAMEIVDFKPNVESKMDSITYEQEGSV